MSCGQFLFRYASLLSRWTVCCWSSTGTPTRMPPGGTRTFLPTGTTSAVNTTRPDTWSSSVRTGLFTVEIDSLLLEQHGNTHPNATGWHAYRSQQVRHRLYLPCTRTHDLRQCGQVHIPVRADEDHVSGYVLGAADVILVWASIPVPRGGVWVGSRAAPTTTSEKTRTH